MYLACYAAISCVGFSVTAHAQLPSLPSLPPLPPAKTASEPSAMERSKRQSENVYKFIKQFADTPRKPDAAPARPKVEPVAAPPAPAPVRRPETPALATPTSPTTVQPNVAPAAEVVQTPVNTQPVAPVQAASAAPVAATPAETAAAVVEEEDDELELVEQVQPQYPRGMQGAADGGKVTVAFTVQPNGSVTDVSVVTATNRRFGKPARDAVAQWRFAPVKVARPVKVEINFNPQ